VIGESSANFEARKINASTLLPDSNGITVTPKHIHRALRDFLKVPAAIDNMFPISAEKLALFG
jgi:hypothetical protein